MAATDRRGAIDRRGATDRDPDRQDDRPTRDEPPTDRPATIREALAVDRLSPARDVVALDRFRGDTRAIEGLPVRLVIALVVGVASLSVMMNMLTGIQGLAVTELDVRPQPEVVGPGERTISLEVVGPDGDGVADATVVLEGGSASLDGVAHARTGDDGRANVTVRPSLGPNQAEGTLVVSVKPPSGSGFVDRRENTKVLVIEGADGG